MSIIGRIVGTLIGAAFGPLGLIAGFVFGNLFDKAISGRADRQSTPHSAARLTASTSARA